MKHQYDIICRWTPMVAGILLCVAGTPSVRGQLPTTLEDFFQLGTQPDQTGGLDFVPIRPSAHCRDCHELGLPDEVPIFTRWQGSMMANAARDPLFHACMAIANQDADFAGEMCIRCHAPGGWLGGRSVPTDGSALTPEDQDGVTCNFCHRLVDPVFQPGVSPPQDQPILDALMAGGILPSQHGGGSYVVDPTDVRRGPFDDVPINFHGVPIIASPFHRTSELCATCHDVSNPALSRQPDGSYAPNILDAPHPTQNKYDMFPLERTYSEWANSLYATFGVDAGGVFGGNHPTGIMRTCQDCHMPDTKSYGCVIQTDPFFVRPNVPAHDFNGGNTWIQGILAAFYPTELSAINLQRSVERAKFMLQNAATLEVTPEDCLIRVRVVNETGHKLPTGYPEGRRMWLAVKFRDDAFTAVAQRGLYNPKTAVLSVTDTKVYEVMLGLDAAMAGLTGLDEGPSFHFAVNNTYYKDNRIPPRGFSNAAFEAVQAAPVGVDYADGQYWDDTWFFVPPGATNATVSLYYQTASKEYIEFLRDENKTNNAGSNLYQMWEQTDKSPPVLMRQVFVDGLLAGNPGDADCSGRVDHVDFQLFVQCLVGPGTDLSLGCEAMDMNLDGDVDLDDFARLQIKYEVR